MKLDDKIFEEENSEKFFDSLLETWLNLPDKESSTQERKKTSLEEIPETTSIQTQENSESSSQNEQPAPKKQKTNPKNDIDTTTNKPTVNSTNLLYFKETQNIATQFNSSSRSDNAIDRSVLNLERQSNPTTISSTAQNNPSLNSPLTMEEMQFLDRIGVTKKPKRPKNKIFLHFQEKFLFKNYYFIKFNNSRSAALAKNKVTAFFNDTTGYNIISTNNFLIINRYIINYLSEPIKNFLHNSPNSEVIYLLRELIKFPQDVLSKLQLDLTNLLLARTPLPLPSTFTQPSYQNPIKQQEPPADVAEVTEASTNSKPESNQL